MTLGCFLPSLVHLDVSAVFQECLVNLVECRHARIVRLGHLQMEVVFLRAVTAVLARLLHLGLQTVLPVLLGPSTTRPLHHHAIDVLWGRLLIRVACRHAIRAHSVILRMTPASQAV